MIIGTFILAFGWFGFNPGSTLAGTDLRIGMITVNTMLSSFTGALGAMCGISAFASLITITNAWSTRVQRDACWRNYCGYMKRTGGNSHPTEAPF